MDLRSLLTRPPKLENDGVLDYLADDAEDYCANFGDQWNRFRDIQIDSLSGLNESHQRFFAETGWKPEDLKDKLILDAGCGAGRFAEVALECGAYLIAADISEAAYACRQTLERFPKDRFLVLRGSLFDLPLEKRRFDGVYSLGVLQHTPDPLEAVGQLASLLAPGGRLATWIYEIKKTHLRAIQPRLWIRTLTAKTSTRFKLSMSRLLTAAFFPLGWLLSWLGRPGQLASYFLPYACRHHLGRGSWQRQWDYCVMDTFDWYGPRYELSQTESDVIQAYQSAGLTDITRTSARGMAIIGHVPEVKGATT
jgi:SAM-dependent methyltransferase